MVKREGERLEIYTSELCLICLIPYYSPAYDELVLSPCTRPTHDKHWLINLAALCGVGGYV